MWHYLSGDGVGALSNEMWPGKSTSHSPARGYETGGMRRGAQGGRGTTCRVMELVRCGPRCRRLYPPHASLLVGTRQEAYAVAREVDKTRSLRSRPDALYAETRPAQFTPHIPARGYETGGIRRGARGKFRSGHENRVSCLVDVANMSGKIRREREGGGINMIYVCHVTYQHFPVT
jgi:hypothetical protein